jgi:hypothetical protein
VANFTGTALPPIVRVGNSADAVPAIDRGSSLAGAPSQVHIVRPTIVRVVPKPTPPAQAAPKPRVAGRKRTT